MMHLPSEGRAFDRIRRCQRAPVTPCLRRARSATGASDSWETGMEQREEVWKECVGWPEYEVSDQGRVRRCEAGSKGLGTKPGRLLRLTPKGQGYIQIALCRQGKKTWVQVHRLVIEGFIGPLGNDRNIQANHKDGVKNNNRLENLEIVTQSENARHSYQMGLQKPNVGPRPSMQGSKHPRAVFNEQQVVEIRRRVSAGERQTVLSKEFGVTPATLNSVVKGRSFAYLQPEGGVTE